VLHFPLPQSLVRFLSSASPAQPRAAHRCIQTLLLCWRTSSTCCIPLRMILSESTSSTSTCLRLARWSISQTFLLPLELTIISLHLNQTDWNRHFPTIDSCGPQLRVADETWWRFYQQQADARELECLV
jgi:hypothetical protein